MKHNNRNHFHFNRTNLIFKEIRIENFIYHYQFYVRISFNRFIEYSLIIILQNK